MRRSAMGTRSRCSRRSQVADRSYLTRAPIQPGELLAAVSDPALGGVVLFLGTARRGEEDGPVAVIEYSAYEAMVGAELERILAEARERWPAARLAAVHRVGTVPAGEASIGIAAALPHRAEAFAACRYVIEEVKLRLPVWKREVFDDGRRDWKGQG
jgi:molybdopterin synthase catalytic subunit